MARSGGGEGVQQEGAGASDPTEQLQGRSQHTLRNQQSKQIPCSQEGSKLSANTNLGFENVRILTFLDLESGSLILLFLLEV